MHLLRFALIVQVAAGQINAPVDVVQLADAIEANGTGGNGSDGSRDAKPSLDAAVSTGVRDLFSSAPTLVLSLARAHTASDAQEQSAQSRATLDWALVDRLASALDGSHSRFSGSRDEKHKEIRLVTCIPLFRMREPGIPVRPCSKLCHLSLTGRQCWKQ